MSCLSEFTYSIYLDGELPAEEARRLEIHLAECSRCRTLVEALRAENRLLSSVLEQREEQPAPVATRTRDIAWTALAVFAAAAGLRAVFDWVKGAEPPVAVEWLNPFSLSGQLNLFFNTLFYFVREGAAMLVTSFTTLTGLGVALLVVGAGVFLLWRRPATLTALATWGILLALALPGAALEKRRGNAVTVPSGETIEDTLLVHAETVTIEGLVTGDLVAFANRLSIKGTVQGDLVCFAQSLDLEGTVGGNVYSFAQWTNLRGQVARNQYAFTQRLQLDPAARVQGDLMAFAEQVRLEGTVGRDALFFSGKTEVRGEISRNLTAYTHRLTLLDSSRVGGDLTAHIHKQRNLRIDPGSTIAGKTETHLRKPRPSRYTRPSFYFWQGLWLVAAFLTGLLFHWLFPALFATRLDTAQALLWKVLLGFAALVLTLVGAIIVALTVIGIPLALIAMATLVVGLYLAKILVGFFVGQALMRPPAGQAARFALPLLVGLVTVYVAISLPYVGGWIHFLVLLLGLGIALTQARAQWRGHAALPVT